jgi:hypothetical protein
MKKFILCSLACAFLFGTTAYPSLVPEDHLLNVYWVVPGGPTIIWTSTTGVPHVTTGYLVGYSIRHNRPVTTNKVYNVACNDYDLALEYLLKFESPVVLPRPVIAE